MRVQSAIIVPRARSAAGEYDGEDATLSEFGGDVDAAPQQHGELLAEMKAKTSAFALFGTALNAGEIDEEAGEVLLTDADAGVGDGDGYRAGRPLTVRLDPHFDAPTVGELDGIAEQVGEDLAKVAAVGVPSVSF